MSAVDRACVTERQVEWVSLKNFFHWPQLSAYQPAKTHV